MNYSNIDMEKLYIWKYGMIPHHFWLRNIDLVKKIVRKYKIPKVDRSYFIADLPDDIAPNDFKEMARQKKLAPKKFWPRPFPGGLRIPHVHLKGEIYILEDKHWKELTTQIVNGFKAKLDRMGTVNFQQVMKLSDAFDNIG